MPAQAIDAAADWARQIKKSVQRARYMVRKLSGDEKTQDILLAVGYKASRKKEDTEEGRQFGCMLFLNTFARISRAQYLSWFCHEEALPSSARRRNGVLPCRALTVG